MFYLFLTILIFSTTLFLYFLFKELQELSYLKRTLYDIIGKHKISAIDDLIKIKNFLNQHIKYNDDLKSQKRPLLRNTATQTLKTGFGFCGENARVAIKLFLIGGIKARRIYLFRKVWQHVLVEHKWENNWFMFDGHFDPDTFLKDEQVASIPSESISEFPDTYPNNPYLNFSRVKLFYNRVNSLSKLKLPISLIYILESPYLIKGIFSFIILSVAASRYF